MKLEKKMCLLLLHKELMSEWRINISETLKTIIEYQLNFTLKRAKEISEIIIISRMDVEHIELHENTAVIEE